MDLSTYEPFLTLQVRNDIVKHMKECGDNESCGLITLAADGFAYHPCENIHEEPTEAFRLGGEDQRRAVMDPTVIAVVHSHPRGPTCPSKADMITQMAIAKPMVIAARDPDLGTLAIFSFGDNLLDVPLEGRVFRHGVLDCYELARGYYWQEHGWKLDQFPRMDDWWKEEPDADMYLRNFESQGFQRYDPNLSHIDNEWHPRPGDALLCNFGANVVNHCAIYVGNNLILHHRTNHKSCKTPVGYLINNRQIRAWIRREQ